MIIEYIESRREEPPSKCKCARASQQQLIKFVFVQNFKPALSFRLGVCFAATGCEERPVKLLGELGLNGPGSISMRAIVGYDH